MAPGDGVEEGKQIPGSWCLSRAEGAYEKKKVRIRILFYIVSTL